MLLDNENAANLIPLLGDRLRLLKKIDELKNSQVVQLQSIGVPNVDEASASDAVLSVPSQSNDENKLTSNDNVTSKRKRVEGTVLEYLDCPLGERIKSNYTGPKNKPKETPFLDTKHQNLLVERIIQKEISSSNVTLTPDRFGQLADEIVEIFPNEIQGTYYIPYRSVKVAGKVVNKHAARGKLWHKYNNECKALLNSGIRRYRRDLTAGIDSNLNHLNDDEIANFEGKLKWLEGQFEITSRVKDFWRETSEYRLGLLKSEKGNCATIIRRSGMCHVNSYITRFPFLRQSLGYTLLDDDFEKLFPEKFNSLFANWLDFERKIKKLCGNDSERSVASLFFDFCNLVMSKQQSKRVTKSWIASKLEILEGFILHVKVIDSLGPEIERICERAKKNKLHVSPFVVFVGDTLENITDSYMNIGGVQFRAASPKHAVDHCMKAVHALHAVYQEQSEVIWLLLQRLVYDITTPWDHVCPVVEHIEKQFRTVNFDEVTP